MRHRVVVVQRVLPHYRVPLFEEARALLETQDIGLELVVGQPSIGESTKRDQGDLAWATRVRNRYLHLGNRSLVWQPVLSHVRGADLVVVEQAGRLMANYVLIAWQLTGGPRVAFWGHGRNMNTARTSRPSEWLKRRLNRAARWWFAYTEGAAKVVEDSGVDPGRITVLNNTTDTTGLSAARERVTPTDIAATRARLSIGADDPVAMALGSIYADKRPTFVIDVADRVREQLARFHLLVVGDGPMRRLFEHASKTRPWMHVVGPLHGDELARHAAVSRLLLNPGSVGLSVVDSFALHLPMVTCEGAAHGPEFEYLTDGVNGVVLGRDTGTEEMAASVVDLLRRPSVLDLLIAGCRESSHDYAIEAMAQRFTAGLRQAIASA